MLERNSVLALKLVLLLLVYFCIIPVYSQIEPEVNSKSTDEELICYLEKSLVVEKVIYNNKAFKPDEMVHFRDFVVKGITWAAPHVPPTTEYDIYYKNDQNFREIVNFIYTIPVTKQGYYESINTVIEKCESFQIRNEIAIVGKKFIEHFFSLNDSAVQNHLSRTYAKLGTSMMKRIQSSLVEHEKELVRLNAGDDNLTILNKLRLYSQAVYVFDSTQMLSELGDVESKIGDLYFKRKDPRYFNKAVAHYLTAYNCFFSKGDTFNANLCLLKRAMVLGHPVNIQNEKNSDLEEIYENAHMTPLAVTRIAAMPDIVRSRKINGNKIKILSAAYLSTECKSCQVGNSEYPILFYTVLGQYYARQNNLVVAISYYNLALIKSGVGNPMNVSYAYESLINLAILYAKTADLKQSLYCINAALDIAQSEKNYLMIADLNSKKANVYNILNDKNEAVKYAKVALSILDTNSIYSMNQWEIKKNAYEILSSCYKNLGERELADYYLRKKDEIDSRYTVDFENMSKTEDELNTFTSNRKIEDKNKIIINQNITISVKDSLITTKSVLINSKDLILNHLQYSYDTLVTNKRYLIDSVNTIQIGLNELRNEKNNLQSDVDGLKKDKASLLAKMSTGLWSFGGALVVLIILVFVGYKVINSEYKKQMANRVNKTKKDLSAKSKAYVHTVDNSFTSILIYIDKDKDIVKAKRFAENSSKYFRMVHDSIDWEDEKWTLGHELELMDKFFDVEKSVGKEVEIIKDIDRELYNTLFLSDALIMLLKNSISHGFLGDTRAWIFRIQCQKRNDVLYFEVSDNGMALDIQEYSRPDKAKNSLAFLKMRVEFTAKYSSATKKIRPAFSIESEPLISTTIKFILPYETTT